MITGLRAVALAAALALLIVVQRDVQLIDVPARDMVLFGWLPAAAVVALATAATARRRWVLVAGVIGAVSPTVLAQFGAGARHGLIAVGAIAVGVGVGPVARRSERAATAAVALYSAAAFASWWSVTPERLEGDPPSAAALVNSVGSFASRAVGGLGIDALPAPTTAVLVWYLLVGVVVGAALASGSRRAVAVPIGAIVVLVSACAVLERWRGPVNPIAGTWLLSGSLAFVASRVELPRRAEERIAVVVVGLVAWAWWWSVAVQVRFVAVDDGVPAAWSRWRDWGSAAGTSAATLLPLAALAGVLAAGFAWRLSPRTNDPRGVNVVGYHTIAGGLGERTRAVSTALRAVGVPVADVDLDVASARELDRLPAPAQRYDATIVVAPAFEVAQAASAHPDLFHDRRLVAGYWFWELDGVPASHHGGIELVDEVWAPTRFVRDAYQPATLLPVRHVPLPIPQPDVAPLGRAELGLSDDAFVFLVSFSHLSVMERKNPLGAIEAFGRAFALDAPDASRFRLVVKTLNGELKPDDASRLRAAADRDPRIEIRPERVDHAELMALVQACDVFVSLHRSEGLGLQIAEAMWLGTAVIATDYSGSRDLIDLGLAELVPWRPVGVSRGDGAYPESFTWADPDLDAAAAAMWRLATDDARRSRLAGAARRRMQAQPDRAEAGRVLARLARCAVRT